MAELICKIHMGTREQEVYIYDVYKKDFEVFKMSLDSLPSFIASQDGVSEVYLKGNKNFISKIESDTKAIEMAKYSKVKSNFHYM